jgi:Flp pilus assembly protein TadG
MAAFMKTCVESLARFPAARSFGRDARGASAVEFALILPLMLALYLGGVQISQAIGIDRKVTLSARTVADLVAQASNTIDSADVNSVLAAATAIMSPYADSSADAARLTVRVSVINIDANLNPTVAWSKATQGAKLSGAVTIPDDLLVANTSLVLGEAFYNYEPPIGYILTGAIRLNDQIYMQPRLSKTVSCSNC